MMAVEPRHAGRWARACRSAACRGLARWFASPAFMAVIMAWCGSVFAASVQSPIGVWRTIDDETHEPRALVAIHDEGGTLAGRIIRLYRAAGEDPDPRCTKCPDERRDQPVVGMTILRNLHREGDTWIGGEILDPESGRIYRANVRLAANGSRLEVRGFIGFALLGRTQVWERVPSAAAPPDEERRQER